MTGRMTLKDWMKYIFWQGQELNEAQAETLSRLETGKLPWHRRWLVTHRRLVGVAIPAIFFHFFWWALVIRFDLLQLFAQHYLVSITMIAGSAIAGLTCEGGGAVAFPVMTLALHVLPATARDFSMAIQSVGMSAASFTIFYMRIKCDWTAVMVASLSGVAGIIAGLELVDPVVEPHWKKMIFVSVWLAFAGVLCAMNFCWNRRIVDRVTRLSWWRLVVLAASGLVGGLLTSLVGSGMDICAFSVLTLLFSVNEKVATPTSVVLMAVNSLVGIYWRAMMLRAVDDLVLQYLAVTVPIVVVFAPGAAMVGSHFHRVFLSVLLLLLDAAAFIGAFIAVQPMTLVLGLSSAAVVAVSTAAFSALGYVGYRLQRQQDHRHTTDCIATVTVAPYHVDNGMQVASF